MYVDRVRTPRAHVPRAFRCSAAAPLAQCTRFYVCVRARARVCACAAKAEEVGDRVKAEAEEAATRKFEKTMTPNVILKIDGLGPSASQDSLQIYLNSLGDVSVKFVEVDAASNSAHVRFENEESARKALEAVNTANANAQKATGTEKPVRSGPSAGAAKAATTQ
ncbi:hypothetical protein EON62_05400, partial [archaeon]